MAKPYKPRAVPRGVNLCCPNCQKISVTDDYDHNAPFVNDELLTGWDITCPYCKKLIRCPIGLQPDQPAFFHALFTGIIRVRPGTD